MDDNDQEKEQKLKMKKVKLAKKIKIGLASAPVFFEPAREMYTVFS